MSSSCISTGGSPVVKRGVQAAAWLAVLVATSEAQDVEPSSAMLGVVPFNQAGHVVVLELYVGGPAQVAGLQPGDQVLAVNGKTVTNAQEVIELIATYEPNSGADVLVRRNGWSHHFFVTLASRANIIGLPRTRVATSIRQEKRFSYRVGADKFIEAETARNIDDPYLRALNTRFGD